MMIYWSCSLIPLFVSDCYRVVVQVHVGSRQSLCPVELLEDGVTIGTVMIQRCTGWLELAEILNNLLTSHLRLVCGSWELQEGLGGEDVPLGLSSDSVASVKIGKSGLKDLTHWLANNTTEL